LVGGCSYTFDDTSPDILLVGGPPNTAALPKLNKGPAGNDHIVLGFDDHGQQTALWAAFTEKNIDTPQGRENGIRAVRLTPPEKEEVIIADEVTSTWTRFFLINRNKENPMLPPIVTVRSAGQETPPKSFQLPGAPGFFSVGPGEEAFLYWVAKPTQKTYFTFRTDGSFARQLKIPPNIDPLDPRLQFYWSDRARHIITREPDGNTLVHSTIDDQDFALGARPQLMGVLGTDQLLTCGDDGLRLVDLDFATASTDGTPPKEQVLDAMPCDDRGALFVRYVEKQWWVYYGNDTQLLRVPLDGGSSELVLDGGRRPLAFLDDGRIMFSKTPADTYVNGAGDGWLDGWNFMQRGLDAGMSLDNKRVRWLERAAKPNGAGELLSAELGQEPITLALNSRRWEELADGRVLADANHAFRGTQNRIVVIDEKTRRGQWVASQAGNYSHIPGTNDLLVDVVSGPTGYDIIRVPIPPPEP
jgi:hypothetical protein